MDGNIRIEDLEQHLLFHKALSENTEAYRRIDGYEEILAKSVSGERLQDPVDEAIRSVFSLVLENGIDPWEIDLSEFARMYNRKVTDDTFDMIVAGKLMLMAWKVLRMQSEATRTRSEPPVLEEAFEVDDSFFFEEPEDAMVVPEMSLREVYQRETVRPVTMIELIDAFEDARKEIQVQQERERVKTELRSKIPAKFDNKAHEEDDQKDVEMVWQKVKRYGAGKICIKDLYTRDLQENLKTFVSVLHLVRNGYLDVTQETLPYGEIYVEMTDEALGGLLEDTGVGMVRAVM